MADEHWNRILDLDPPPDVEEAGVAEVVAVAGVAVREKNNLEQMEAKLYVPIQTIQGQLSGILVLGQKLSQQNRVGMTQTAETYLFFLLVNVVSVETGQVRPENRQRIRLLQPCHGDCVVSNLMHGFDKEQAGKVGNCFAVKALIAKTVPFLDKFYPPVSSFFRYFIMFVHFKFLFI
jgi:hypothetical protein